MSDFILNVWKVEHGSAAFMRAPNDLTVLFDAGGTWNDGGRPGHYYRGIGFELLGEVKLLYALGLQLRLGVAHGLDEPRGTRGYLTLGRAF